MQRWLNALVLSIAFAAVPGATADYPEKSLTINPHHYSSPRYDTLSDFGAVSLATESTPEKFAELIRAEYDRWGKVVTASGAKAD